MAVVKNITHESPGAVLLNKGTLHHTTDGHYKYYYVYRFQIQNTVYIEKRWGRIGAKKGTVVVNSYNMTSSTMYKTSNEYLNLIKAKRDKGYKDVDVKSPVPAAEPERVIGLSRFRDIV